MTASQQYDLANEYVEAADAIADRSVANQIAALDRSIKSTLADLRRYYASFTDESKADHTSYDGVNRRPGEYSIRQSLRKLDGMYAVASGFVSDKTLMAWQQTQEEDLQDAALLGGDLSRRLIEVSNDPVGTMKLPPSTVAREALLESRERASAYIRAEISSFRDSIVQITQQALLKGTGFRGIEAQVRQALNGAKDPYKLTQRMGLKQRAELIARSEIANAFVGGQLRYAKGAGYSYVRWIATKDELACKLCASRHGVIYRLGELVAPAHPRCRCVISPVPNEAVESGDPDLLDNAYWGKSQETMRKELAAANGWDLKRLEAEVLKALKTPTPSERRQRPGIEVSASPVVDPLGKADTGTGAAVAASTATAAAAAAPQLPAGAIEYLGKVLTPGPRLGGSTGALLFLDSSGKPAYVVKGGGAAGQNIAELAANRVYEVIGRSVPVEKGYGNLKLDGLVGSRLLPDGRLINPYIGHTLMRDLTPEQFKALDVAGNMRRQTFADALVANWDSVGMDRDNIMVNLSTGQLLRIDTGGSFHFRAQGAQKDYGLVPMEVFSMRKGYGQHAQFWNGLTEKGKNKALRDLWTRDLDSTLFGVDEAFKTAKAAGLGGDPLDALYRRIQILKITKEALHESGAKKIGLKDDDIIKWSGVDAVIEDAWKQMYDPASGELVMTTFELKDLLKKNLKALAEANSAAKLPVTAAVAQSQSSGVDPAKTRGAVTMHGEMPWGPGRSHFHSERKDFAIKVIQMQWEKVYGTELSAQRASEYLEAVYVYTNGRYTDVVAAGLKQNNQAAFTVFKKVVPHEDKPPVEAFQRDKAINELMSAMPVWRGGPISRGIGLPSKEIAQEFIAALTKGSNGSFGAIQSFESGTAADNEWGKGSKARVVLEIKKPRTGVSVAGISANHGEAEILMSSTARYRVLSVKEQTLYSAGSEYKYVYTVSLEEVL